MRQAFFATVLLLASCAFIPDEWYEDSQSAREIAGPVRSYSILPPPADTIYTGQDTIYETNYELNVTRVAKTGDPIIRVQAFKKDNFTTKEMMLERPVTVTIEREEMKLPAKKYPIFGVFEYGDKTYYVLPKYKEYYFLINMRGEFQPMFLYEIKNSDKVTILNEKAKFSPENVKMKRYSYSTQETIPFLDYEIVYDGVKNDRIVLFYKNAVPGTDGGAGSFDTESYPANSTLISVHGRLIRVLHADNNQMTYIILKEYSK